MIYHHPFPIKTWDEIRSFVLESTKDLISDRLYVTRLQFPDELQSDLNREIVSYGLPLPFDGTLIFKRKHFSRPLQTDFHVDSLNNIDEPVKTSLVIPIEGCENTAMLWATGDYKTRRAFDQDGNRYRKIDWGERFDITETKEILEPTLCKVDIPHHATSDEFGNYRTIASIRFFSNPSIEEIISKRFTKG